MASRITTPGAGFPGVASGVRSLGSNGRPLNEIIAELEMRRLRMGRIPVGSGVADIFPWMRRVTQFEVTPDGIPQVIHEDPWDTTFTNQSDKRVLVTEVRVTDTSGPGTTNYDETYQQLFELKMSIPPRRQIVERWLPWGCFTTEADRFLTEPLNEYCWRLPAPYFLSRTQPFIMDIHNDAVLATFDYEDTDALFFIVLRGWGTADGEPIELIKAVPPFEAAQAANANGFQSISFDEDRDRPLRDAWITEIGFGSAYLEVAAGVQTTDTFRMIRVRPNPPEGPRWHRNEFYALHELGAQEGIPFPSAAGYCVEPWTVIHCPVTPYVLEPGESFQVEIRMVPQFKERASHYIDAVVFGVQEG